MELSMREAKAKLGEAAAAAANGERVVLTKHGRPFVEIVPARQKGGMDFAKADEVLKEMGLDGITVDIAPEFNDPAYSRRVLGLED